MNRQEQAVELKHNGYNCCQAVTSVMADLVKVDESTLTKITSGFGTGMGCMEGTCGSLVGAIIVAGLLKNGKGTVKTAAELHKKFEEYCGASICKDLKGKETGKVLCSCDDCVRNAVRVLEENL